MAKSNRSTVAFDRASSRVFDEDGHLHVARTPISKATVNEYLGSEIPGWRDLKLDGQRRYKLLRDPEELARAVDSFNNKPLLYVHRPVTADDHDHSITVGTVSNPVFEAPYLYADLTCWDGKAIGTIRDESQKELSSAYRYEPDMTPGTFEGVSYDGVMRNIAANHVALVKKGRAGPDVVVGDSMERIIMSKRALSGAAAQTQGALAVYLRSKLAQDQTIDLRPVVDGLTRKNFRERIPHTVLGVQKAVRGKLAKDADIEDVAEVVEALVEILPEDVQARVENGLKGGGGDDGDANRNAEDDDEAAELKAKLEAAGLSAEQVATALAALATCSAMAGDRDPGCDPKAAPRPPQGRPAVRLPAQDGAISQEAFDRFKRDQDARERRAKLAQDRALEEQRQTITSEITERFQAIDDARRFVRPWVGEIAMSFDSAEGVYREACSMLEIKHADVHASALPRLIEMKDKPGEARRTGPAPIAQDAASGSAFAQRYPGAARISHAA